MTAAAPSAYAQAPAGGNESPSTATSPAEPAPSTGQGAPDPAPSAAAEAGPGMEPGPYVFGSPPSAQANRLYSVNVRTGEVSACQFERPEGSVIGVTKCFPRDSSAGPSETGTYDLISTRYSGETGIFRVNAETGQMSVCYVRDMPKEGGGTEPSVVCTKASH
ncbi:hypothetical protein [Ancylobacter mangrovi]|uniref:hypothetical protein n=1 Tax=Ancylobacter mangrovi TaxID=2972472 RepID=UPI002162B3A7|nr:hypothetical protein [Ancylobacter mangrovi]MCS0501311.1 hypothetical protein [Ancylobacter mangrovi]